MPDCKHFLIFYIDNDGRPFVQAKRVQVYLPNVCEHAEINSAASKWMPKAGIGEFWLGRDFAVIRIA